jgi:hypothetical protein
MANRSIAFLFVLLVGAFLSPFPIYCAQAQEAQPTVELTPATLDLPAKGEAQTQLVLRNKSNGELQNIKLDWFTGTGAIIKTDESKELDKLSPQAEKYWTLRLSQDSNGLIPGNIYFRVSYNTAGATGVPRVLFATLITNSRQSDEVSKVVEVVPQTASTQLNEQRSGQVFLVISNKSNLPIRVGRISTSGPGFIGGAPDMTGIAVDPQGFVKIEARDSLSVPVQIKVTDVVRPGKHLLIFQVPVEWGANEQMQKANVIAKQEFDVGILGESELLTALGLPSFLILPGFLILVTFRLLNKGGKGEESMLKNATNPALWIGAITLSGVMAFLYPLGTKLLGGVSRNYLIGYGLGDVIRVWIASIITGLLAWMVWQLLGWLRRRLFLPATTDTPRQLLWKLFWHGLGVSLYKMTVKINGVDCDNAFLLEKRRDNQETFWVGPYINITFAPGKATPEFKARVAAQLESEGSALKLARLIKEGEAKGMLQATWDTETNLKGVREVKKTEVVNATTAKDVIAKQT